MALYPTFAVHTLQKKHGHRWAELVDSVSKLPVSDPRVMAFSYTMRRLNRNLGFERSECHDPLCAVCATEIVKHFRGSEDDLVDMYYQNLHAIKTCIKTRTVRERVPVPVVAIA
jgi:hypothetical protein